MDPRSIRNIGISAHIDAGKTTLSERVLFYTGRIHRMQEVHGQGPGATLDYMDLERERGITITSAATTVAWQETIINLIDTPGHVDFTVEVERSLRVLDGAILVLCAVAGVQAQSLTIDRQMRRYGVPRLAFINKMDRPGADPEAVAAQLRQKLGTEALLMQLPIGLGAQFRGVVDLVAMEAVYFEGRYGEAVRRGPIPGELGTAAQAARRHLLESLAMYSDELLEVLLAGEEVPEALIYHVAKLAVGQLQVTPVFLGSAYRNKGVQPLLDAVVRLLPSPAECDVMALDHEDPSRKVRLSADPDRPAVAMAFKILEDPFGTLTFMRVYQGRLVKGRTYYNQRTGSRERFGRIVRMHADQREDVSEACAGEIVAVLGVDAASGDTYAEQYPACTLEPMYVPDPVMKIAVAPARPEGIERLAKALARFRREDPTLHVLADEETGETIVAGMGELHLDVYMERIRREYGLALHVGPPKVNYRETPTQPAAFNVRHRKQTGGAGQYAHIIGRLQPLPEGAQETFLFEDRVSGGRVPKQFIPSIEKGFRNGLRKGPLAGFPVIGLHVVLEDGSFHEEDSSDLAFQICAETAMRETFPNTRPVLLEPVMKIEIECPEQFQGPVVGDLVARRGQISATAVLGPIVRIQGELPLAETFGYSTRLRSMTQGQGTFTLEFARYKRLPAAVQCEVIAERRGARLAGAV